MRRAKIVCTLGPAVGDAEMIRRLVDAGMDVARLNMSHGTHEDHRHNYDLVRQASDASGHGVGIIADQLGSFMVLSTLGILAATLYSSGSTSPRQMARKILMFPPFQALILAFFLRPVPFPAWTVTILEKLGSTLTPLALVSVGFQLHFGGLKEVLRPLAAGLAYKLFLGPVLIYLLYVTILGSTGTITQVTVFEAAMAPMITAGIIAVDHDLEPPLVAMLVGIGIPLSFVTLYFWHLFLAGTA